MSTPVPSPESIGPKTPPLPPQGPAAATPGFSQSQDPWQKMLGPTATPLQVKQFKEAVIRMLNSQMQHERDRMRRALRRMRKEEE
jgi:hypothetical protein